ncbi:MAG: CxxC-x17-CxxC domain-containing protein [bacterium]
MVNEPERCPECRSTRRREQQQSGGGYGNRASYSATCAECGAETTVPFEPT